MSLKDRGISTDDFLWLLAALARLGGVPFDANAVLPRYPAPRAPAQIALVAAEFGLKLSPVPSGVTPVAALGWIGWRAADAAEAPTTKINCSFCSILSNNCISAAIS